MNNKKSKLLEPSIDVKENIKKLYMILGVLQIFKLILWFVNTMFESYEFFTETKKTFSMCTLWADDAPGLTVAAVILSAISIAMCVLPILKGNFEKRIFPIVTAIILHVSCICFAIMYITILSASSQYGDLDSAVNHKVGLTFWGYLQLISLVASVVIAFMLSSKTKAISNWKKQNCCNEIDD